MPINVIVASDDGYAPFAAATIRSTVQSASAEDQLAFHFLTFGLSQDVRSKLQQLETDLETRIHIVEIDPDEVSGFPINRYTLSTYLRLYAPEKLSGLDRAIYLDADVLVMTSLAPLLGFASGYDAGAAALDSMAFFSRISGSSSFSTDEDVHCRYFNSGVMVMNLDYWRQKDILRQASTWLAGNPLARYSDQSALNVVLKDQIKILPLRYNLQTPLINLAMYGSGITSSMLEACRDPGIVHFVTERKPWERRYRIPYAGEFRAHLAKTPWGKDALPRLGPDGARHRMKEEARHLGRTAKTLLRSATGLIPEPVVDL